MGFDNSFSENHLKLKLAGHAGSAFGRAVAGPVGSFIGFTIGTIIAAKLISKDSDGFDSAGAEPNNPKSGNGGSYARAEP